MQSIHKDSFLADIQKRGIGNLIHFTATSNISSILQNGILSKAALSQENIGHVYNDEMRLEGFLNSISLSIEFPNYSMFSKYRIYGTNPKNMAVILIDPQILLDKDCAFYHNNAASADFHNIPVNTLKNYNSWSLMFAENYKGVNRADLCIPSNYTTHPQAEVLCFDKIETKYIKCIIFENQQHFEENYLEYNYPSWNLNKSLYMRNHIYYKARSDYKYWKK